MIGLSDLECDRPVAVVLCEPVNLVVEDIGEPLQEEQGQEVVLELGRILLSRIEQAASQSICSMGVVVGAAAARRRRVTPAATGRSRLTRLPSIPDSVAKASIIFCADFCGAFEATLHRFMVANDTSRRSASCSWVRLSLIRIAWSSSATPFLFVMFVSIISKYTSVKRKSYPNHRIHRCDSLLVSLFIRYNVWYQLLHSCT